MAKIDGPCKNCNERVLLVGINVININLIRLLLKR